MVAPVTAENVIEASNPASQAIQVLEVSGGKETSPLWKSEVGDKEFLEALKQSLQLHTLLAENNGRYHLEAELQELKQPFAGFSMTVRADVHYTLTDTLDGKVLLDEVMHTEYTASFGDALAGVKRLQLANEGAIKSNIADLISKIVALSKSLPDGAAQKIALGGR